MSLFEDFSFGSLLPFRDGTKSNNWFYSLDVAIERIAGNLHDVIERLSKRGVQTRPIWGLIHEQRPYEGAITYCIERAIYYSRRVLNLPCSTQMTEDEVYYAAKAVMEVLEEVIK